MRWFPELRGGLSRRAKRALLLAGLLLGLVAEWLALPGQSLSQAGGDLAAGLALIVCGLAAWSSRPESRVGALLTLTGFAWFLGTFAGSDIAAVAALGAAVLTFHRGVLFHAIVTYPGGRLTGGRLITAVVALGYAYAMVVPVAQNDVATTIMVILVLAATVAGYLRAAGPERQARLAAVAAAVAAAVPLAAGSVAPHSEGVEDPGANEPKVEGSGGHAVHNLLLSAGREVPDPGNMVDAHVPAGQLADPVGEVADLRGVPEASVLAITLCERSLVAMARGEWSRAEALARQAGMVLRRAGIEDSYTTPLVCAVRARAAWHRGDIPAARRELVNAQRLRHLLTYALPHLAVQARIELIRVHIALADLAGARTLMQEIGGLLKRRPGLGTLVEEAEALRALLTKERGLSVPGASALTAAELRLLPMLSTHLSSPEMATELVLSPHTIKSQMRSIYRKLDASTRNQAVARARELGLLEG